MTIVCGQYSMYMPPISGMLMSSIECKLFDEEEEVFHKVSVALSNNHIVCVLLSETQTIVQVLNFYMIRYLMI